jgi:ribonuclease P protein component
MATFTKKERLCLKKEIADLFEKGEKWSCYPFRIILNVSKNDDQDFSSAILVSVAKKNFRLASDRNKIKRQIRESYRLYKTDFLNQFSNHSSENPNLKVHIGFIYNSKTKEPWNSLSLKLKRALNEVAERVRKNFNTNE